MLLFRTAIILAFIFALITLAACSRKRTANTNAAPGTALDHSIESATAPKDDLEEFGMLVNLPFTPDEVIWKATVWVDSANDSDTRKLVAVIRFSGANASKLAEHAARVRPAARESLDTEAWYPAELIAQSGMNAEGKLSGESYSADEFVLAPYTLGKITRIENTDYFILELYGR